MIRKGRNAWDWYVSYGITLAAVGFIVALMMAGLFD